MRKLLTLLFFTSLFSSLSIQAQLVSTVAGVIETQGYLDGPALQALFNNPHGIAIDNSGTIYVADRYGHRIRKISNGMVSTLAGSGTPGKLNGQGTSASFNEPWGICVTPDGSKIYVADTRNNLIRVIDSLGNVLTLAGSGNYGTSDGFRLASTFGNPTGIEIDQNGVIYVADHLTHIIRKIDVSGFVTTLAGSPYLPGNADGPGSSARFYRPYGLTIDNSGNIIVADEWNHLIRKITPDGVVSTLAGTNTVGSADGTASNSSFNYPWDVAIDSVGNVFVADGFNNVMRKIDVTSSPDNPIVSTYVGTAGELGGTDGEGSSAAFNGATSIAYSPSKDELFVADAYNQLIRKIINLRNGSLALQTNPDQTEFCAGETVTLQAIPATYDSYYFYVNDQILQNSESPFFSVSTLPEGVHTLRIAAEKDGSIINSNEITITVSGALKPTVTVVGETEFFEGDSVVLISSNAEDYFWSNGFTDQKITVFESGDYTVQVTDANGCTNISDPIIVRVTPVSETPVIGFVEGKENNIFCNNDTIRIQSSYATNNQWFKDGWPIEGATGQSYVVTQSGTYHVQVTDDQGFKLSSNSLDITILPQLLLDIEANNTTPNNTSPVVKFSAQTAYEVTYLWDFGDPASGAQNQSNQSNPNHRYISPGQYTVSLTVTSEEGCTETLTKTDFIDFQAKTGSGSGVFIPTAFTPNDDGINDVFLVRGESISKVTMYICNPWGELVFQSGTESEGWDGKMNGKKVQNGNYTYLANVEFDNGDTQQFTGHVTVLR